MLCIASLSLNSSKFSDRMFKEPLKTVSQFKDSNNLNDKIIFTPVHDSFYRTA